MLVGATYLIDQIGPDKGITPLVVASLAVVGIPACAFVYYLSRDALSLLSEQYSSRRRVCYDDLLATSALSEQEVVVGTALALAKRFWPISLAAALLFTLTSTLAILADPAQNSGLSGLALFFAPFQILFRFVSSMLAVFCLTLWLMSQGGGRHSAALVHVGSGVAVLVFAMQTAIAFALQDLNSPFGLSLLDRDALGLRIAAGNAISFPLLACLGLYLARRLEWLRFLLGGLLAIELLGVFMLLGLPRVWSPQYVDYAMLAQPIEALWSSGALAVLNVQGSFHGNVDYGNYWFDTPWRPGLLLLLQLIFIVMLAEFARDAIRRRKWGQEGD